MSSFVPSAVPGSPVLPPRSVDELVQIPHALKTVLPGFIRTTPDLSKFWDYDDPVLQYFVDVVAPYGRILNKAFPSAAMFPADVLPSSKEYLVPHVFNFLRFLVRLAANPRILVRG